MKKSIFIVAFIIVMISTSLNAQKLENLTCGGALLSKSSPASDTIRMIPKDSVVRILSEPNTEGYILVRYEGNEGFIQKDILTVTTLPIDLCKYRLNQRDEKGKKDSLWIDYLDENWKVVKNSTKAKYYRYEFYFHGRAVMGEHYFKKNWTLHCIGDSTLKNNNPVALNGEYKWHSRKGFFLDCYYMHGQRIWYIVNYPKRADTKRTRYAFVRSLDFRNKYKGEPFTATEQIFFNNGHARKYFLRFDTVTWSYNEGVFF